MIKLASHRKTAAFLLLSLIILVTGNHFFRNNIGDMWAHPDQAIPVKVMQAMESHGDLNTDWARADLPDYFKACRYNFSGYILASYLVVHIAGVDVNNEAAVKETLLGISSWSAALTLVVCFYVLVLNTRLPFALAGTAAIALLPQLFQDAHYVRPEAVSTLLFTCCFALATVTTSRPLSRFLLLFSIGFLAGFLTSIKFTYAICALFCMAVALPAAMVEMSWKKRIRSLVFAGSISLVAIAIGFCVGAPASITDLSGYIDGIEALGRQYGGGHPPHGLIDPSSIGQFDLVSSFYLATLGPILIGLHILGYSRSLLSPAKYAYALVLGVTFVAFLTQRAFFERNLSPFLPVFMLLSMIGAVNLFQWLGRRFTPIHPFESFVPGVTVGALVIASLVIPYSVTTRIASHFSRKDNQARASIDQFQQQDALRRTGATRVESIDFSKVFSMQYPRHDNECIVYSATTYNDEWSARYFKFLPSNFLLFRRVASDFDEIPVSTLHAYHSPTIFFFFDPTACEHSKLTQ